MLSQLHKERQSVAEERTKLNVSLTVQREESEDAAVKLAQVLQVQLIQLSNYKYIPYNSDITSTAYTAQKFHLSK